MLKFGTHTIALPLAIKRCTVQTGCTVDLAASIALLKDPLLNATNKSLIGQWWYGQLTLDIIHTVFCSD